MKKMVIIMAIAVCLLSGCGKKEETVNETSSIEVETIEVETIEVETIDVQTWDSATTSFEDF